MCWVRNMQDRHAPCSLTLHNPVVSTPPQTPHQKESRASCANLKDGGKDSGGPEKPEWAGGIRNFPELSKSPRVGSRLLRPPLR